MREDRLSPEMGRLIDAAKSAAARVAPSLSRAEGVALLTARGTVYAGYEGDPTAASRRAVDSALAAVCKAGDGGVLAAAVAVANDPDDSVLPSSESIRSLTALDPGLPVAFKKLGRWVSLPVSEISRAT